MQRPAQGLPRDIHGTVLVTGAAGFIGFHVAQHLLRTENVTVVGIDNLSSYYSVDLKEARLSVLQTYPRFMFILLDIANVTAMHNLFQQFQFSYIIHLAAQAGVRHSFSNPLSYVRSNLDGFMNILEGARHGKVIHLLYASSSSVYGGNSKIPFSEGDQVDLPLNLYAATKKANEAMAYSYASLFNISCTGMRFFTVYGPWGRPDMAVWSFTAAITDGDPLVVFNNGMMRRDFTYIDDVVTAIRLLLPVPPQSVVPHEIFNIGNRNPIALLDLIQVIEAAVNKTATLKMVGKQPGELETTYADTEKLRHKTGFAPIHNLCSGIQSFADWYGYWTRRKTSEYVERIYRPLKLRVCRN